MPAPRTKKSAKRASFKYPAGFVWGCSTSSFQIEGATQEDGRGDSIWDARGRIPGKVANGDTGDVACDHYHRYREDVALMKGLGLDAYRFSVAWPRVLPEGRGAVNDKGLDFYDRLIDAVLAAGIDPWLCLYHWDLPQALHEAGGWPARDSAGWFADYAALVARRYGDRVKRWATFNEFSVFTLFGYAIDWGAPGITDREQHLRAIHHVNLAHGAGVDAVRALAPKASVGAIHNVQPIIPEKDTAADREAAADLHEHWNLAFPDPQILAHYPPRLARAIEKYVVAGDMARICRPVDWFGLNHYGPIFAKADSNSVHGFGWGSAPADAPKSDIGWPVFPEMFADTLVEVWRRYGLPVYVTENGCGGNDASSGETPDARGRVEDKHRLSYLKMHTAAMEAAMRRGADVRGYFVWSLLDNFEWGSGYGQRFGIVRVDYKTQQRTPKASYAWYRDFIRSARAARRRAR
ncbi:MAG: beta-glucosidase [Rhodospirillales bacterium]|nr:beta-glucosidase [Rhodospirillales bacterium]